MLLHRLVQIKFSNNWRCDLISRTGITLDSLQEAKFVLTLDLRPGYWQEETNKASR